MRGKFLVLTFKKWLKLAQIYRRYCKIKTGMLLYWTALYIITLCFKNAHPIGQSSMSLVSGNINHL